MSDQEPQNDTAEATLTPKKLHLFGNSIAVICLALLVFFGYIGKVYVKSHESDRDSMQNALVQIQKENDKLSSFRINQCHSIQQQSLDVLERTTAVLADNTRAITAISHSIQSLERTVEDNSEAIEGLKEAVKYQLDNR